mgnify:CR=1 FL=1
MRNPPQTILHHALLSEHNKTEMHTPIFQLPRRLHSYPTHCNAMFLEKQHLRGIHVQRTKQVYPTYLHSQKFLVELLCVDDQPIPPT